MKREKYFLTHSGACQLVDYFSYFGRTSSILSLYSREFLCTIQEKIRKIFPDTDVEILNLSELQSQLVNLMKQDLDLSRSYIVSLEYDWVGLSGYKLEMCRAQHLSGENAGYCERPGALSLDQQFSTIANEASDRVIVLTDDGLFSGETLLEIIRRLRNFGKDEFLIYVQVATSEAVDKFKKEGVQVKFVRSLDIPKDWVCERDLRYGTARTGKPIVNIGGDLLAVEHFGRKLYFSRPYPHPTGDLSRSASIPPEYVIELSDFIFGWHMTLFTEMEERMGVMRLHDLSKLSPMYSIPYYGEIPDLNLKLTEYLHEIWKQS